MNLSEQIQDFLQICEKQNGYAANTLKTYSSNLRRFARWTDVQPETDAPFALAKLRTFMTDRQIEGNLRPRSVHIQQSALQVFGDYLVETGVITENPVRKIRPVRMDDPIVRAASEPEAHALLDGCDRLPGDPKRCIMAKAVMSVFLFAGLRHTELLTLDVSDVSMTDNRLLVRLSKGKKSRSVPLSNDLRAAMEAWLNIRTSPEHITSLFLLKPWRGLSTTTLRVLVKDVRAAGGLRDAKHITPHSFRRYFASTMQRNGVSLAAISKLMGHSSVAVTAGYLQTSDVELEAAVELTVPRLPVIVPEVVPEIVAKPAPRLASVHGGRQAVPSGPRKSIRLRMA